VNVIKDELETKSNHRLLIVGESGTSKSTILMEIMCDYFDKGYEVLYNFGETVIRKGQQLIEFVEGILDGGSKVLVAVDDDLMNLISITQKTVNQL
jgi:predicted ATP-dependent serine protease